MEDPDNARQSKNRAINDYQLRLQLLSSRVLKADGQYTLDPVLVRGKLEAVRDNPQSIYISFTSTNFTNGGRNLQI